MPITVRKPCQPPIRLDVVLGIHNKRFFDQAGVFMTQWSASHLLAATMQLGYRVGPSPRIVLKLCSLRLSSPESLPGQDRGAGRCVRCTPRHRPAACGLGCRTLRPAQRRGGRLLGCKQQRRSDQRPLRHHSRRTECDHQSPNTCMHGVVFMRNSGAYRKSTS